MNNSSFPPKPEEEQMESACRQIVVFRLNQEFYGVDIDHVETVIVPQGITIIPGAVAFVRGVINLRGTITPVVDLRARFGLAESLIGDSSDSRIVIVHAEGVSAGLIVNSVTEVCTLREPVEAPMGLLASGAMECITGIAHRSPEDRRGGKPEPLILILDIEKVLGSCLRRAGAGLKDAA